MERSRNKVMKAIQIFKNAGRVLWCIMFFAFISVCVPCLARADTGIAERQPAYILSPPSIKTAEATSKAEIVLSWKRVKNAERYTVYRASEKKGIYKAIKSTSKCLFRDKTGKQLHTYYYKITASYQDDAGQWVESGYSKRVKARVRKIVRKTAYVGDSVMRAFSDYKVLKSTKKQKIITRIGVSTVNFYNSNLMDRLLKFKPDRMFIMLGINALYKGTSPRYMDHVIKYYDRILKACLKKNPHMEIIVMSVSPVGKRAVEKLKDVKLFNRKLKKLLKKYEEVQYMDLFPFMTGSDGYLKKSYNAGDGVHWNPSACRAVLKKMKQFVKIFR